MKNPKDKTAGTVGSDTATKQKRFPIGKAFSRAGYFNLQRGLPPAARAGGRILPKAKAAGHAATRFVRAFRAKMSLTADFAHSAGLPVWRSLGPAIIPHGQTYGSAKPPVSGRCCGISVDPQDARKIIVCSAGGGLWGSNDAGVTWRPLTDEQPLLSMGALARAAGSPNILYAGTGEGDNGIEIGVGLLRSKDGGATWTHVPSAALVGTAIYDIAVHPGDPQHLWIATISGLMSSPDGGSTCSRVRPGQCWSVSINPRNPQELLAAAADGLQRSLDGGATWTQVALPGLNDLRALRRMEVCHAPSNPGVAFVTAAINTPTAAEPEHGSGLIWRRANTGAPFRAANAPGDMDVSQAWYDWCMAVSPADPNLVYWGAIELYRGKLGSAGKFTWSNISSRQSGDSIHPDQHHVAFDPADASVVYACNDGGVFRSPDRGSTWRSLNPGLVITEFEFLAHRESTDDGWLIGGTQDNGSLENRGAGAWDQVALGDGGDCAAVQSTAGEIAYHSYYYMSLERRVIGPGQRWRNITPPPVSEYGNAYADGKPYPCLFYPPMDATADMVGQAGHTLFVSGDCGDNWEEISLPGISPRDYASTLVCVSASIVVVGTVSGAVFRVQRGPAGWSNARVTALVSPRQGYLSDIISQDVQGAKLWISCSRLGGAHVFFSADGGQSWVNRSGNLPDTAVNALALDPQNAQRVFAATDHGVFESTDGGSNWRSFSNGLPNTIVGDLIFHPQSRILRAGTRGRGAWEVNL